MNFQIAVALACLLDIRMEYTPVHAYAWAQSCSWIKFSFEYGKVLIQYCMNGPCSRTHDLKSVQMRPKAKVIVVCSDIQGVWTERDSPWLL